jgi:hypothetical protein
MATRTKAAPESTLTIEFEGDTTVEEANEYLKTVGIDPTTTVKPAKGKKEPEESFADLAVDLSAADAKARATSADAGQARAERSTIAVSAIKAAFREKIDGSMVRRDLIDAGVLKGTASKIVTVLAALNDGTITPSDVKSLNGAYNLVKSVAAATAGSPSVGVSSTGSTATVTAPGLGIATPDEALKIILHEITSQTDPDKAFKIGGEWITKVTNAITEILKKIDDDDEDENDD